MSGIDYSKWDKIVAEMSSSDEDNTYPQVLPDQGPVGNDINMSDFMQHDEELSSKLANVTRLKKPSSVTIGPQGTTINPKPTKPTKPKTNPLPQSSNAANDDPLSLHLQKPYRPAPKKDDEKKQNETETTEKEEILPTISMNLSSLLSKWTHNGGIHKFEYLWSQTADELIIRFLIPSTTKGKHVKINFNAESKQFKCNIISHGREWNVNKTFSRKLKESDEEDANLDWELCNVKIFNYDNDKLKDTLKDILCLNDDEMNDKLCIEYASKLSSCRFLKLSLEKERINDRVIEWWDDVFVGDTKIDLKQRIKDRKTDANKMKDIWNKAHEQFKEKVKDFKPTEIVVPDDDEDEDEDDLVDID